MADIVCIREGEDVYTENFSPGWRSFESEELWQETAEADRCIVYRMTYDLPATSNMGINIYEIEHRFQTLVDLWRNETRFNSSITEISMAMAYQQIIGMGPVVIPFILRELANRSGHWFWALHAITGVDPTTPEQRGRLKEMADAWLHWGRERGYI